MGFQDVDFGSICGASGASAFATALACGGRAARAGCYARLRPSAPAAGGQPNVVPWFPSRRRRAGHQASLRRTIRPPWPPRLCLSHPAISFSGPRPAGARPVCDLRHRRPGRPGGPARRALPDAARPAACSPASAFRRRSERDDERRLRRLLPQRAASRGAGHPADDRPVQSRHITLNLRCRTDGPGSSPMQVADSPVFHRRLRTEPIRLRTLGRARAERGAACRKSCSAASRGGCASASSRKP